jgi:hypothetical protein
MFRMLNMRWTVSFQTHGRRARLAASHLSFPARRASGPAAHIIYGRSRVSHSSSSSFHPLVNLISLSFPIFFHPAFLLSSLGLQTIPILRPLATWAAWSGGRRGGANLRRPAAWVRWQEVRRHEHILEQRIRVASRRSAGSERAQPSSGAVDPLSTRGRDVVWCHCRQQDILANYFTKVNTLFFPSVPRHALICSVKLHFAALVPALISKQWIRWSSHWKVLVFDVWSIWIARRTFGLVILLASGQCTVLFD